MRVDRGDRRAHDLADLNVSIALAGDLADTHLTGDNANVLPTDTQKNTVYAFARQHGVGELEEFALRLARHFVDTQPSDPARAEVADRGVRLAAARARTRSSAAARRGAHRGGQLRRRERAEVVCGLADLVLLNTTGSEFLGFVKDRYTTLPETNDRILATAVDARWRHARRRRGPTGTPSYEAVRAALVAAFVDTYSRSLQQTLLRDGRAGARATGPRWPRCG